MPFQLVKLTDPAVTIKPNLRGVYDNATAYNYGDSVTYNGSSYTATATTTGNLPTNTTYWQLAASKGDTGATGATGATGPQGPSGTGVPVGGTTGQALVKATNTDYDTTWGSAGHTIQEEGTPVASRAALNFIGASVTVTDNSGTGATDVTITAGGSTVTKVVAASGGDYTTLGAAIAAASAGWVIQVKDATTETGAITSALNNLTIIGSNRVAATVGLGANLLTLSGTGVTLLNLGISATTGGVVLSGANAVFQTGYISSASIPTTNHLLMSGADPHLQGLYYEYTSATSLAGKSPVSVTGANFRVAGCRLYTNGLTAGGYLLLTSGDGGTVVNCTFKCVTAGQTVALRVAGSYAVVSGCYIEGANNVNAAGISIANNYPTITGNTFKGWGIAVLSSTSITYLALTGNNFEIPSAGAWGYSNANQLNVATISGNSFIGVGATSSIGLRFNSSVNRDIVVTGNTFYSLSVGVQTGTNTGQSTGMSLVNNQFRFCTTNTTVNSTYHNVNVWNNSGLSDRDQVNIIEMKNTSGALVAYGSCVTLKVSTGEVAEFTTTTTASDPLVYGITGDDIGSTATGSVILQGQTAAAIVRVDGSGTAIAAGDFITTSTTAGIGVKATTGQTAYAIALAAAATSTRIKCLIIRPRVI